MGKFLSIILFTLLAEIDTMVAYSFSSSDLSRLGYAGPVVGAIMGAAIASLCERLWSRLKPFSRCVIYVAITMMFINAATAFYQCLAEQITYHARMAHPQEEYTYGAWGNYPWMMYPELANAGFATGMAHARSAVLGSLLDTAKGSIVWLPVLLLIAWLTTRTRW